MRAMALPLRIQEGATQGRDSAAVLPAINSALAGDSRIISGTLVVNAGLLQARRNASALLIIVEFVLSRLNKSF